MRAEEPQSGNNLSGGYPGSESSWRRYVPLVLVAFLLAAHGALAELGGRAEDRRSAYYGFWATLVATLVLGAHTVRESRASRKVRVWEAAERARLRAALRGEREELEVEQSKLKVALAELDALFENAPVGLVLFDRDIRYRRTNRRLAEINGIPAEAHVGKRISDILPHLPSELEAQFKAVIDTGHPMLNQEVVGETPAAPGKVRVWNASYFPVRTAEGAVIGMGNIVLDVTEQRRLERERRESAQMLDAVLQNAAAMVAVLDEKGTCLLVNRAFAADVGCAVDEMLGHSLRDFVPSAVVDQILVEDDKVRRVGVASLVEQSFLRDGRTRFYQANKFPLGAEYGFPGAVATIVNDVTEQTIATQRTELVAKLAGAIGRLLPSEATFDCVADVAVPAFADGVALLWQVPGERMLVRARHADAFAQASFDGLISSAPPTQLEFVLDRLEASSESVWSDDPTQVFGVRELDAPLLRQLQLTSILRVPVAFGTRARGVLLFSTSRSSGRQFIAKDVSFARDLAGRIAIALENAYLLRERARAFEELQRANERLEARVAARTEELTQSLQEKSILLMEVHHRVKNNLQITSSLLNMQRSVVGDESARAALTDAEGRVRAMAQAHERLYASKDFAHIDLADHIRELVAAIATSLGGSARGIEVDLDLQPSTSGLQVAVPLGLILNELLSNAFKHAFVAETSGRVRVSLSKTREGLQALVVEDNGTNTAPALPASSASIGLLIVKTLVKQLGGTLVVHRPETGGSRFALTFPSNKKEKDVVAHG